MITGMIFRNNFPFSFHHLLCYYAWKQPCELICRNSTSELRFVQTSCVLRRRASPCNAARRHNASCVNELLYRSGFFTTRYGRDDTQMPTLPNSIDKMPKRQLLRWFQYHIYTTTLKVTVAWLWSSCGSGTGRLWLRRKRSAD